VRTPVEQSCLDRYIFFLDRSLGKYTVAEALRKVGAKVEIHDDHFPQDAHDEMWLTHVGQQGWVVLTKDDKIRYHPNERMALMQAGVCAFVLVARNLSAPAMAEAFVKALSAICQFLENYDPPFIARVTRNGGVSMIVHQ
jgi:hypothetical protein